MPATSGKLSRASALSSIELVGPLTGGRLLFLMALGALTVLLHQTFHYPLRLPGHHGLEAMALLVLGRLSCSSRWAATTVALSAATTATAIGGHEPAAFALTLAPGVVLDLALMAFAGWRQHLFVLPLIVAVAHATKPLARWGLAELSGFHFGSLRAGVLYPLSTHLLYGFAGALIAVVLWTVTVKRLKDQ